VNSSKELRKIRGNAGVILVHKDVDARFHVFPFQRSVGVKLKKRVSPLQRGIVKARVSPASPRKETRAGIVDYWRRKANQNRLFRREHGRPKLIQNRPLANLPARPP
jgi:hypothetical protein